MTKWGVRLLAAAWVASVGCTKGVPELTVLTGRVTLDGQPVPAGSVEFVTTDNINSATAELQPDGTYRMPGAPVGEVRVAVATQGYARGPKADDGDPKAKAPRFVAVPKKFQSVETSGITTSIKKGQPSYDIELTSK